MRASFVARLPLIVLPGERDVVVSDLDKAMIGDGDAVCIAAQVPENLLGPGKGLLSTTQSTCPSGAR